MLLTNGIYIRCIWGFIAASVLFYCLPYLFTGYDTPVLPNGNTIYDIVYFNSERVFRFTLSMAFSVMCLILDCNFKNLPTIPYIKYLAYSISAILFTRMCFHFYYYNHIQSIELYLYGAFVVLMILRAWYTIGNLKLLYARCLMFKFR